MPNSSHTPRDSQSGAALIVGLVLMMVLTILAVSTMRTSTLELSMAGNTQYYEKARQLAEAGLADAINQIDNKVYDPDAINPGNWDAGVFAGNLADGIPGDAYSVDIRFLHNGPPPAGNSQALNANYFELQSTGMTGARNARVILRRGFWKYPDTSGP
ncbi:MAG: pilus assembly PilX family protein [Gammaproteobacteria bacterium]